MVRCECGCEEEVFDDVMEFLFWEAANEVAEALEVLAAVRDHKQEQPIPPDVQKAMDDFRKWRS